MSGKTKCKSLMTWRSFHIFIMVWFALNVIVRLPNEVCIWLVLAAIYYIGWQYSIVIYRATLAYVDYCLNKEPLNEIFIDSATIKEKEQSLKEMDNSVKEK